MTSFHVRRLAAVLGFCVSSFVVQGAWAAVGRTAGSFDVSQTGEARYSIPIFTPPGTGEMTPRLALTYGHRGGNGLLGVGWNISGLSAITRCPKTWAQDGAPRTVKLDYNDRFCLDGNQLKWDSGGTYGYPNAVYRTELETFARVISYGTAGFGPAYFVVEHKNGLIYEYGNSADSRIEAQGFATPRTWALNKIRDRAQNAILFNYTEDATNGSYRISSIQYTSNPGQSLSPAYAVNFTYEGIPVGEVDSRFRAGGLVKRITRLDRIDVTHSGNNVRRYELSYFLASTSRSRLISVQECAGVAFDCLPATTFTYQNGSSAFLGEFSTSTIGGTSNVLVIDINGDARSDVVYSSSATSGSGTWMQMLANGSGGYNSPVNSGITNTNFSQAIPIDYNADGLEDFLVPYSGGTWWVVQGSASGLSSPINTGIPADGAGGNARALDMNGDGLDDLVWAYLDSMGGDSILYRLRVWGGTFGAPAYWVGPVGLDNYIIGPVFDNPPFLSRHREPDFNGDGCGDWVVRFMMYNAEVGPWPPVKWQTALLGCGASGFDITSMSSGINYLFLDLNADGYTDVASGLSTGAWSYRFSKGTSLGPWQSISIGSGFLPETAVVVDADGDGYEDILLRKSTTNTWHLMRSTGEALSAPTNTSLSTTASKSYVGDIDGDGLVDALFLNGSTLAYRKHGAPAPDLLTSATDGYGMAVNFSYVPITQGNYSEYSDATFPEQDYQGALYVVSSLTASTGIASPSTFTQSFWYYGARVHRQGRGFEGFYARRTTDDRNNLYAYEYFNRAFPQTGTVFQSDLYQPNGSTLISRRQNGWTAHSYGSGNELRKLPFVESSTSTRYEVGGTYNEALLSTASTSNLVDSATGTLYDSTTTTTEASSANGAQAGQWYTQRTYHSSLFNNFTYWCFGRPEVTQAIGSHTLYGGTSITRQVNTTWDAINCRPTQSVVQPGDSQWQVTRTPGYDGFGNVNSETVTGIGMAGRTTAANWGTTGQFPVSITNALSQTTQLGWDATIGTLTGATDPNGIITSWEHDVFGRQTKENRPDNTDTTWTYNDCSGVSGGCVNSNNKQVVIVTQRDTTDGTVTDQWTYFDKFNRPIVAKTRRLSGEDKSRVDREYDALGRLSRESAPCASSACTYFWTTLTYDLLSRPTQVSRPTSDSDSTPATTTSYYEGLTTRIVDPLSKQSTKIANVLNGLARSIDHAGYYQTFDVDGFGNTVRVTDSLTNTLQSITYNVRGMKTAQTDMDLGSWTFTPNALGEVVSQTDAKSQNATLVFDKLGRLTSRTEPEGTSTFTWGVLADNSASHKYVGHLKSMSGPGYTENYTLDSFGRPEQTEIISDATYYIDYAYNTIGALHTLTYPTSTAGYRLKLQYDYENGLLKRVKDFNAPSIEFWQANATDPRGAVIHETLDNGLQTIRGFDLVTGLIDSITTGPSGGTSIQNLSYAWDKVGNLTQRHDGRQSLTENFSYDNLHRLTSSTGPDPITVAYDALGNITSKSDVAGGSNWAYHATKKHAVTTAGTGGPTFAYDANGNVSTRNGSTISWYSHNLPNTISASGSNSSQFFYTPDRARWKQVASYGGTAETTIYIGGMIEKVTLGAVTSWKHYISGGSGPVAVYTRKSGAADEMHYLTKDHLGSVDSVTNALGGAEVRLSYSAFGQRRKEAGWSGNPLPGDWTEITDTTRRGFTFHEMLDNLSLTHMNGRVYDQVVGRFLSADPYVQAPGFTQSFNRYSYVTNNPLSFTDPSGFNRVQRPDQQPKRDSPQDLPDDFGSASASAWAVLPEWVEWLNRQQRDPIDRNQNIASPQELCGQNTPCDTPNPTSTVGGTHSGQFLRQLVIGAVDSFLRDFWESPRIDAIGDEHPSPAEIFGPYQSPFAPPVTNEDQLARDLGPAATIVLGVVTRRPVGAARGILGTPRVGSQKLQNIINDLYRGTTNPNRIGNGTTADAIRHELATGQPVGGAFHSQKGADYARGLENWLRANPNAPYRDRVVAQSILDDLRSALGGGP